MGIAYKQKCCVCKKNFVTVTSHQRYAVCYDCQKKELGGKIKDPKMKKLFNLPEAYYKENSFLRNIKINYLKFDKLTDKQIAAFKKVVKIIRGNK